jgi:hypothetical protein
MDDQRKSQPDQLGPSDPQPDGADNLVWIAVGEDPSLASPVQPGTPARQLAGDDLDLNIGWHRFEQLALAVSKRALGLRGVKVRRYGVRGQAQHGIDLAGREPDGRYTVIQCKDYQSFTVEDFQGAVKTFTHGRRPFRAYRFIVATSALTESTQFAHELAAQQDAHPDLDLDLWGSEQINEHLRYQADVVARFWTRETANVFCTGAPLPGVPAPPPDRQEQAERILLGPLNTSDVKPLLRDAEKKRAENPGAAAQLYRLLAERLQGAGFRGHAVVLRRRQLDALYEARLVDEAIALAGELAVAALHHGDRYEARVLAHRMQEIGDGAEPQSPAGHVRRRHIELIHAAVEATLHPLGSPDRLWNALRSGVETEPEYQPSLVLLLAEDVQATEPDRLPDLDGLLRQVIDRASNQDGNPETVLRLRLACAEYDQHERRDLATVARRHLVAGAHAALISAREARRCCLEGRAEEALEAWRDAVHDAIHAGLSDDAANWLYAIRSLNALYGSWTTELDDEHRLAQALRATASGHLLDRVREPSEAARAAIVAGNPIDATLWGRRWLVDAVVTGCWAHESEAIEFLGDIYRDNQEPGLAAVFYQRVGQVKKATALVNDVGDVLLPVGALTGEPWWMLCTRAAQASAQADLLDDDTAATLVEQLTEIAVRGRAGELADSPDDALTLRATQSLCDLAARGTAEQAAAVLDVLATDVAREPNRHRQTDDYHAEACAQIALTHTELTVAALARLLDLARYGVRAAQKTLVRDEILALLSGRGDNLPPGSTAVAEADRRSLCDRVVELTKQGCYLADVALSALDPEHPLVRDRAHQARSRILERPDPDPTHIGFGTSLVRDAYLASILPSEQTQACLTKLMTVAADAREAASNRQDALTAARNFVLEQARPLKAETFTFAKAFVTGEHDGSHLDELTGKPHPLSAFKVSMGSASLRGHGLRLAHASATTADDLQWVRDQAVNLLRSSDPQDNYYAAS